MERVTDHVITVYLFSVAHEITRTLHKKVSTLKYSFWSTIMLILMLQARFFCHLLFVVCCF